MKKLFYLFFLTLGVLLLQLVNSARAQNFTRYKEFETYQVIAPSGMNLREAPSTQAAVVAKIPFGSMVTMTDAEGKAYGALTVDGIEGHWVKARYDNKEGYMFSGYFYNPMKQPAPEHKDFFITLEGYPEFHEHYYDPNFHWYGVYRTDSGYEIEKVQIHFEGDAFQKMATNRKGYSEFLVGSRKPLHPGKLNAEYYAHTVGNVRGPLDPGEQVLLQYDYAKSNFFEMLTALGKVSLTDWVGIGELGGDPQVGKKYENYTLVLTRYSEDGEKSISQKFVQMSSEQYWTFDLIWFGDLDGDGFADLVLDGSDEDRASARILYLSSQADKGKLIKRVASVAMEGGC